MTPDQEAIDALAPSRIRAADILDALIARSDEKLWATELAFFEGSVSRIDFWTLEPVGGQTGYRATAYEIKVDRADFRRDTEAKQADALRWSDRFWYVAPPEIIPLAELPPWAGLQIWNGSTFQVARRAPRRAKAAPTWPLIISIIRNSGDCRRDVSALKAELAFHRSQAERERRQQKLRDKFQFDRLIRQGAALGRKE